MSNQTETGLQLKPYESAVIENLLSIAPSQYLKTAMTKGLNYLETVLLNADDENSEPVSDRALWTAVVASEGTDIEVFLAAILAEVVTRNPKMTYLTAEGFPYYMTLAAKALAEDVVDNTLYERIALQDAKYQSIAVYRSMYRLANIITYPLNEQVLILSEVDQIKSLTMSPSLYAQYDLVYTQAINTYNLLEDFDDLMGNVEDVYDAGVTCSNSLQDGEDIPQDVLIDEATVNQSRIRELLFKNPTEDIDELVADEFNCKVGGVILLPKGRIHYSPQWKQYFDATGNPINWTDYLDLDASDCTEGNISETHSIKVVIARELTKDLSVLTLDRRIATELGLTSGDFINIPTIGECIYNTVNGFISTESGEMIDFRKYEWSK
jgi:hypothetical protein